MPNNWKIYKLREFLNSANTGLDAIKRAPIVEENTGIKCLRIQDVSQRKAFKDWGFCEVTQNNYEKFSLNKDEIIIARTGNTIGVNMFIEENLKSVFNNGLIRLRVNKDLCFPKYVYYNFRNKRFVDYINGIAYGTSTQPNMQINSLLSFEFLAPSIPEQQSIASILSAIDEKIENNLAINKTLEEMAMALYKHWFVDFGPFQNGEFVESELGLIPKGWEVKRLVEFVKLTMGQSPKSEFYNLNKDGLPFHQGVTNYGVRFPEDKSYSTEGNRFAEEGDILFSVRAPVGRLNIAKNKIILGRGLSSMTLKNYKNNGFLFYSLKNFFTKDDIIGDGTVYGSVNKTELENLKFIVPCKDILEDFNELVKDIDSKYLNNYKENQTLTQLRDTLLPKLISGEVRLKEFRASE
jgi:type I restriction enzyme S subunit